MAGRLSLRPSSNGRDEITAAAYEAIRASLPDPERTAPAEGGLIGIWLDRDFLDRLKHLRGPGQSYSDVILRLRAERTE
jgi:hypothetical protein